MPDEQPADEGGCTQGLGVTKFICHLLYKAARLLKMLSSRSGKWPVSIFRQDVTKGSDDNQLAVKNTQNNDEESGNKMSWFAITDYKLDRKWE